MTRFLLENQASAVYLSRSGYTLTFGTKSEGSLACSPCLRRRRGRSLNQDDDDLDPRVKPGASWSREPSGRGLNDRDIGVLSGNHIYIVMPLY